MLQDAVQRLNISYPAMTAAVLVPLAILLLLIAGIRGRTPLWLVGMGFLVGGLITLLATWALNDLAKPLVEAAEDTGNPLLSELAGNFLQAGASEEIPRFLLLLAVLATLHRRRSPQNAVPINAAIGLGFAAVENIIASWTAGGLVGVLVSRTVPTISHASSAIIMGDLAGHALGPVKRKWLLMGLALLIPILFHGTYDLLVSIEVPEAAMAFDSENLSPQQTRTLLKAVGIMLAGIGVWVVELVWAVRIVRRLRREHATAP